MKDNSSDNGWDERKREIFLRFNFIDKEIADIKRSLLSLIKKIDEIPEPGESTLCRYQSDEIKEAKSIQKIAAGLTLFLGVLGGYLASLWKGD